MFSVVDIQLISDVRQCPVGGIVMTEDAALGTFVR